MNVLALNAGSSSLKFKLLKMDAGEAELAKGLVEHGGASAVGEAAAKAIERCRGMGIDAVAHRVVHGGPRFVDPVRITDAVVKAIAAVAELAPLHNDAALAGIEAARRLLPGIPQVAVFDTAFHRTMPQVAANYAIPRDLAAKHHLRRFGFHGISHRFVCGRLLQCINREPHGTKLITCHLGNGASVCAIRDGQSVDTSMGLTPMEGLMMGTRSGDIDPGLVLHLITSLKMTAAEVDQLLNHQSGLAGVSGIGSDLREIEKAAVAGDENAKLAIEMFAYRARKFIGAYAAALAGIDAIALTGGIGEHSPTMRRLICDGLEFIGVSIAAARNEAATGQAASISTAGSRASVWVIATDEELQMAREAGAVVG